MTRIQKLLLLFVIVIAVFFRFYLITDLPGGLFPDEAANGLDINLMEQGQIEPFYERGNGREGLFFYLLWASVEVFGRGAWQHHIVSSGIGVLAVVACFLFAKKLFELFAKNEEEKINSVYLALTAAFFMATSSWHVVLSRTAFRANLIPLFTALTIFGILCIYGAKTDLKKKIFGFISGAIFALGFYSYIAYRIMVPFLGIALIFPLLANLKEFGMEKIKTYGKPLFAFVFGLLLFISPLAHYFYTHPGSFIGRSGQVSVFNPDLNKGDLFGTITDVFQKSVLAFFIDGDVNWRHNVSGYPFLPVLISPFFFIGMIIVVLGALGYIFSPIKKSYLWKYFLLAGFFWSMLIPVVTTAEGIPHGLRSIGVIPPVFIISSIGIYAFFKKFLLMLFETPFGKTLGYVVVSAYFLAIISQTYFAYFVYAANSPENYHAFRSDLSVVSEYLKDRGNKNNTYLVLDKFSVQTTDYLTTVNAKNPGFEKNQPYVQVDPEDSWKLDKLKTGDVIVFTQSSIFDTVKFKKYHPEAVLKETKYNKFGEKIMMTYLVQ